MTNFQKYKPLTAALSRNTSDKFCALSFEIWDLFGFCPPNLRTSKIQLVSATIKDQR